MNQRYLFVPVPCSKFDLLTKDELIVLFEGKQVIRFHFQKECEELKRQKDIVEQKSFLIEEQLIIVRTKLFRKSSERSVTSFANGKNADPNKKKKVKLQLPSLRYPNAPLVEKDIEIAELPSCNSCGSQIEDSGLTEDSVQLTMIPRQFSAVRYKSHKYRCGCCHGDLKTAPALPKIKEGSAYSDDVIVDVALSKYGDLIPIDRYVAMAKHSEIMDLPPNSLIQLTHHLADFLEIIYKKRKVEITKDKITHGDETPHRMLERDEKSNWSLWGFSTKTASYFEAHSTRSGDVAIEFFMSDSDIGMQNDDYIRTRLPYILLVGPSVLIVNRWKINVLKGENPYSAKLLNLDKYLENSI